MFIYYKLMVERIVGVGNNLNLKSPHQAGAGSSHNVAGGAGASVQFSDGESIAMAKDKS
jgi:hypothetical protein